MSVKSPTKPSFKDLNGSVASPTSAVPVLVDFLNSTPAALTSVLVGLAPWINRIRHAVEIASWKSPSWFDSWLALAAWWAACLLAEVGLRYLLPFTILFMLAVRRFASRKAPVLQATTERSLESTILDLTIIQSHLPTALTLPLTSPTILLRVSAILYIPYLILTFFVQLRLLVALTGTVLLSWRAPWAIIIRASLWRSAWVRWATYRSWSYLSGEPLPPITLSMQPTATTPTPVNSVRFLFTVYENQRWWMGLDWTAALLPNERPSWCSATQMAVPPPSTFALPEDTVVYLDDGAGKRVKRTGSWKWEEGEWRVFVKRDGAGLMRVEKPVPVVKEDTQAGNKLLKMAGKMREASSGLHSEGLDGDGEESELPVDDEEHLTLEEPLTDIDGWIYADNKWEAPSNKGGLGKYTRYRRWTRVAILSEVVEVVDAGETGVERNTVLWPHHEEPQHLQSPLSPKSASTFASATTSSEPMTFVDVDGSVDDVWHSLSGLSSATRERTGSLKQRLKDTLRKGTV